MNDVAAPQPERMGRLPALDGLRGLAILMVMVLHFTQDSGMVPRATLDHWVLRVASYGRWGVDLFFVLSGFLITGILCDSKGKPGYLPRFYARRALRIFPVYYAYLAVWFMVLPMFYTWGPETASDASHWWCWTFTTNISQGWYGDLNAAPTYTGHFWSLAVEEQFYLLWPILVLLCSRRSLILGCLACLVASPLLRAGFFLAGNPIAAYVLMPARVDALAVGALVALLMRGTPGRTLLVQRAPLAAALSLATIALSSWAPGRPAIAAALEVTLGYSAVALFFGAVLALVVAAEPSDARWHFLRRPSLQFFGKYSYSLYVIHLPVAFFVAKAMFDANRLPPLAGSQLSGEVLFIGVAGGLSAVISLAIWHGFEKHFERLKRRI